MCVFEGVARVSADEMSWRLSMVPMHWVFEYPRSRLYTYLSPSLPSGIVQSCICVYLWLKVLHVSIVNSMLC